ncbi:MAG TPA: hypothetical protein RMF84_16580 [Polyangiaceae bacterium LLY-WYZ-14_1]|nr:hypothetical protein [Polyangiaceae bacterium LLY-WYZ-14_1]
MRRAVTVGLWAVAVVGSLDLVGCAEGDALGGGRPAGDADGDFIPDELEGRLEGVDTDRDLIPDYLDLDSDGDGIPDPIEAGDLVLASSPLDSDDDGVPDFQDADSDGNGILDADEIGPAGELLDTFGDGVPDYRDLDDDEDLLLDVEELAGIVDPPVDSDGDGVPDYQDPDSDGDTILDGHDTAGDTDRDGLANLRDIDSDGDGIPDVMEAGDGDIRTLPVDTDEDGAPDFMDFDSDDDGLRDDDERLLGTSAILSDTDGDGVTDLVELLFCEEARVDCSGMAMDGTRSPRTEGSFVFTVPFEEAPDPPRDVLRFGTDIREADVYLLLDTTCSMVSAVESLQESLTREPDGLIARVKERIPEAWFGVGQYRDYPVGGYGSPNVDYAYHNVLDMTDDKEEAQRQVNTLVAGFGGTTTCFTACHDRPESQIAATYATVTGNGLPGISGTYTSPGVDPTTDSLPDREGCPDGRWGYPCFRERSVPIVLLIADAPAHNGTNPDFDYDNAVIGGPAPTFDEAAAAVVGNNVTMAGLAVLDAGRFNDAEPTRRDLEAFIAATRSVDRDGHPFVSDWNTGDDISDALVDQIETVAASKRFNLTLSFDDARDDAVDTFDAFVDHIRAVPGGETDDCPFRIPVDTDEDGIEDTFPNVGGGSSVCFEVVAKDNRVVDAIAVPQLFRATLSVIGDGFAALDRREVYFLVPADPDLAGLR